MEYFIEIEAKLIGIVIGSADPIASWQYSDLKINKKISKKWNNNQK